MLCIIFYGVSWVAIREKQTHETQAIIYTEISIESALTSFAQLLSLLTPAKNTVPANS